jgi:biotin synthase-like enzyme
VSLERPLQVKSIAKSTCAYCFNTCQKKTAKFSGALLMGDEGDAVEIVRHNDIALE